MKKLMTAAVASALAAAVHAEMKIGTVDMMTLVRNHASYEPNRKLLASTEEDYQKRLAAMQGELEKIAEEGKKHSDELRNPMLAQAAKTKAENALIDIQKRYLSQQQKMRNEAMRNQQDLQDLEARLLKAQAEDIRRQVSRFAEANGYTLVVDASAALFAGKGLDVTDGVLRQMGVDPKQARDGDEGK